MALAPGDVIEVKFFYTPQLNEIQTVRPDGKIGLQLIGEINVQGKTPAEIRKELLELYAPHLEEIEVAVIVRSFWNRRVYVGGQVITPGLIEMPGRITALEAITQAGGFDLRMAEPKSVIVIRHKNGQRLGYKLDMRAALAGETTDLFFLEPQDIVYVPQTRIAQVNQWIDQYVNKIIPDTGMFFRTARGRTEVGVGSYR
jgi:protein involved in polysaccharide export with SLBB domain